MPNAEENHNAVGTALWSDMMKPAGRMRVAIVEDDKSLASLLAELFEDRGWESLICADAGLAAAQIKAASPAVVVLDVVLGAPFSGWKVLQMLKQEPATRDIPVVVCSGDATLIEKEDWLNQNGIPTVRKPFDLDDLLREVDAVMSGERGAVT